MTEMTSNMAAALGVAFTDDNAALTAGVLNMMQSHRDAQGRGYWLPEDIRAFRDVVVSVRGIPSALGAVVEETPKLPFTLPQTRRGPQIVERKPDSEAVAI